MENLYKSQDFSFLAAIFTVFLCFIFGSNIVAIKISLHGLGTFTTAGIRFTIASAAILLWAKLTSKTFSIKKGQAIQLLIVSIIFTVQLSMFYLGISKTHASRGTLFMNMQPFFITFLAHYFIPGDQINIKKIIGLVLGFIGVLFVVIEKKGITADFQMGDIIILVVAFIWACHIVYIKRIIHDFEPFHFVFYPMIFSIPFFFIEGYLWDSSMVDYIDIKIIGSLLYQSLVTASFGFVAWNYMLQEYGATALHSFVFIMPVAGVLLGSLVLGEPLTFNILISLLFIILGIIVIHINSFIRKG
ncbi:DMT family transporter [Candidatus Magnetomoraceae bacterium gMMP-15]